jgi:Flp pilus assembly pilin Flp
MAKVGPQSFTDESSGDLCNRFKCCDFTWRKPIVFAINEQLLAPLAQFAPDEAGVTAIEYGLRARLGKVGAFLHCLALVAVLPDETLVAASSARAVLTGRGQHWAAQPGKLLVKGM